MKPNKFFAGEAKTAKRTWSKTAPVKFSVTDWRWARFKDARVSLEAARKA